MANATSTYAAGAVAAVLVFTTVLTGCSNNGSKPVQAAGAGNPAPSVSAATSGAPSDPGALPSSSAGAAASEDPVAAENNPPGDIPDNLAFVLYRNAAGHYSFTHPEGWAETENGTSVVFTDKLNGVQAGVGTRTSAVSAQQAKDQDVPALQQSQSAFELRSVTAVKVGSAQGVKIVYRRNSAPDAVTGRQYRDEVERYELVSGGRELIIELYGPVGADNVDAYKTMIDSLRFA